jgi:hypothetical protein
MTLTKATYAMIQGAPLNIVDYPSATGDWGASLQSAINALGTAGGEIVIPNLGTEYAWKSVPKFPASLTGKISIIGVGTPVIKFTATGNRFLDPNRTADYQTFRNLLIDGLYIDTDGHCDFDHIVFGTRASGTWTLGQRANFDNITIQNVECVNVGIDPLAASGPFAVGIASTHLASAEATQTTVKNITVKNVVSDGGFSLALIAGIDLSGGFNANVYLDNIIVEDCRHMIPTKPTSFFFSSSYIIGGGGFGNRAYFRNLYGQNSGDNIYEVDAMQYVVYDNCTGKDPYNLLFYTTNYHAAPDYRSQTITYNNCGGELSTPLGRAFGIGENNGNALGKIVIDTPSVYLSSIPDGGYSNRVLFMDTNVSADVEVRSPMIDVNFAGSLTGDEFPQLFQFRAEAGRTSAISNMNIAVRGSLTTNGFNWSLRIVGADGAGNFNASGTNQIVSTMGTSAVPAASCFLFNLGELVSGKLVTSISGIRGSSTAGAGNALKFQCVKYRNNLAPDATHTHLLYDCDFSGFNAAGSSDISIDTAAYGAFIRRERIKYLTIPAVVTETVGASPVSLTNLYGTLRSYVISGGTVSDVSLSNNGGSTFTSVATATGATVLVDVGQVLRITYTGLPTVKSTPASGV